MNTPRMIPHTAGLQRVGLNLPIAVLLWAFMLFSSQPAFAQEKGTGAISGRAFNNSTGEYLNNARVRIKGTESETFTDSSGQFDFSNISPGAVEVEVFYTGLGTKSAEITVKEGQTITHDFYFSFGESQAKSETKEEESLILKEFVVKVSKEMNGAAIAINEQRFADNFKTVVSADEFGPQPEGNVGEFMKFLPGVVIDQGGGEPRVISLNGAPSNNVPVTVGGFALASAASGGTSRQVELEQVSVNNLSRIEVNFSPTPESPGSALAGSVNLVPRKAFERSRPEFNFTAFEIARSSDLNLQQPGPFESKRSPLSPGLEFSYLNPVNKKFGFTLSGAYSTVYTGQDFFQNTWRGVAAPTGGNFPLTTVDKPYLSEIYSYRVVKYSTRASAAATLDFKPSRTDTFSFSFNFAHFYAEWNGPQIKYSINRATAGNFGTTFVHSDSTANGGQVELSNGGRKKIGQTIMPTFTWRHDGPLWKAELGMSYSSSVNHYRDAGKGVSGGLTARLGNVEVDLDNVARNGPTKYTVKNGAGAVIDETNLNNYVIVNETSNQADAIDAQRNINGSLRRDFATVIPISLKIGGLISEQIRDTKPLASTKSNYTYVGQDGVATNTSTMTSAATDDNAGFLTDRFNSYQNKAFSPKYQVPDPVLALGLFQDHPNYFVSSSPSNDYNNIANNSKRARERIFAGYLRNDLSLFRNRLKIVYGLRVEQTNVHGEGPSNDPSRNFQRDANGVILRTGNPQTGNPILIYPANSLEAQRLILVERGLKSDKEYIRPLPSVNVAYTMFDSLIARGSYYWSLGRPDFSQYVNGATLPNLASPPSPSSNFIQIANAGIKAWSAETKKIGLEYYFSGVGQISVGVWQRDFKNLFGNIDTLATPEALALYGLSYDTYAGYYIRTTFNAAAVRMRGLDIAWKENLSFLPGWGKNFIVFANMSFTRFSGLGRDQFSNNMAVPRTANWGVNYRQSKYSAMINWNYRGLNRQGIVTGTGIEANTYNYQAPRLYVDLTLEYSMTKNIGLFANCRNIRNQGIENLMYGPNTPANARLRNYETYGAELTAGVKARF